jgi:hypothetical protein
MVAVGASKMVSASYANVQFIQSASARTTLVLFYKKGDLAAVLHPNASFGDVARGKIDQLKLLIFIWQAHFSSQPQRKMAGRKYVKSPNLKASPCDLFPFFY